MKKWIKTALCVLMLGVGVLGLTGCTTKGKDGKETSYTTYTITYDYGSAEEYFEPAIKTENIESNVWLSNIPQIKEEKYKKSFLGWFIQGTNKKIELYDFIGGNVTLEARFDVKKGAPSGLYKDQKQALLQ